MAKRLHPAIRTIRHILNDEAASYRKFRKTDPKDMVEWDRALYVIDTIRRRLSWKHEWKRRKAATREA